MVSTGRPKTVNEADSELTATGQANQTQLAALFKRDPKSMPRLLDGLAPSGERRGFKTYWIYEAAQRLVKPGYEIEQYLRRMHPSDLPNLLSKDFWNGQRARQAFEEIEGDLWRTGEMVGVFAEACATVRTSLLLFRDALEREESLTEAQQEILGGLIDGAIKDIQEALVERFASYEPPEYPSISFEDYRPTETDEPRDDDALPLEAGDDGEPGAEDGARAETPSEYDLDGL